MCVLLELKGFHGSVAPLCLVVIIGLNYTYPLHTLPLAGNISVSTEFIGNDHLSYAGWHIGIPEHHELREQYELLGPEAKGNYNLHV